MPITPPRLAAVRDELPQHPGPVVVFNKSHSGSRLLAAVVERAGVFMGAHQNDSRDSLDVLELVQQLVLAHYPDYGPLWDGSAGTDPALPDQVRRVFAAHLQGFDARAGRWGWKLCETVYILPVVDFLFPAARYVHLIRDGRDVAFCDHHGPSDPFWKKVYFNTATIARWRGRRLTGRSYRRWRCLYNAQHWVNSVTVGRRFGAMLRERYLEVRYEDLCLDFERTVARLLDFLGLSQALPACVAMISEVRRSSIGKHAREPWLKRRMVDRVARPLLLELGYLPGED